MVTFSFFFSIALSNDSDLEDSYRRWQTFYPVLFALCSEIPCSIMYGHSYLSSVWPWDVFTLSCLWGFFMGVWKAQIKVCDHFFTYPRKTRLILQEISFSKLLLFLPLLFSPPPLLLFLSSSFSFFKLIFILSKISMFIYWKLKQLKT